MARRRAAIPGLATVLSAVLVACTSAVTPSSSSQASVTPSVTQTPAASSLPILPLERDTALAAVAANDDLTLVAVGDTLLVGGASATAVLEPPAFAYDPATGIRTVIPIPRDAPGKFTPMLTAGTVVVGIALTDTTSSMAGRVVIADVGSGRAFSVAPKRGFDAFFLHGLGGGFAFGEMAKLQRSGDGFTLRESRAVLIDIATGAITDLTPADAPVPSLAQVRSVNAGRALVAVFEGDEAGSRPLTSLTLVDLATMTRSTPDLPMASLVFPEAADAQSIRLDGALIVGVPTGWSSSWPGQPFVYQISTKAFDLVPMSPAATSGACDLRVDATRLVCHEATRSGGPIDGRVFLYDVEHKSRTDIAAPGLEGFVHPTAVAGSRLLVADQVHTPLLYDIATATAYRLDVGTTPFPYDLAIVGDRILKGQQTYFDDPRLWNFDARFWRMP